MPLPETLHKNAHAPGLTSLAFSPDGKYLYTAGDEGNVRIWSGAIDAEEEPDMISDAEGGITSLAASNSTLLCGSTDSVVRQYQHQSRESSGFLTRCKDLPVRDLAIDGSGQRAAVVSDDVVCKIISVSNTRHIDEFPKQNTGYRRVTWHPSGNLLTTSGSDGKLYIWDVSGDEAVLEKVLDNIIPSIKDFESPKFWNDCSAAWHPSGQHFYAVSRTHDVVSISRESWRQTESFSDPEVFGETTSLTLSPNGMYLLTGTAGFINVWSTTNCRVLFRHKLESLTPVLRMEFSPTFNLLAWTNAEGTLSRCLNIIPNSSPDPVKFATSTSSAPSSPRRESSDALFKNDADQDMQIDGAAEDYGDHDWIIDDIGQEPRNDRAADKDEPFTKEMVNVTKAQSAFQPGATPLLKKRQYLAYNMIGVIEVIDQDTHHIVNVEFHDQSTRKGHHFSDHFKYDLASLGEKGALYACPPEADHPARITYKPFGTWQSTSEWSLELTQGETVTAVAVGGCVPGKSLREKSDGDPEGNGNIVIATSRNFLRFFSGGGVQRYIWNHTGDVIALVAGREWVFVVHRDSGTSLDGAQNLRYSLIAWDTFDLVQQGFIPLSRNVALSWIGISEEGAPVMYDSVGLLSVMDRFRRPGQGRWVPLLDTLTLERRKGKDESYWPVGVSESCFSCVILKGREEYPGFPRPYMQEIELEMPMVGQELVVKSEEKLLRDQIFINFLLDGLGDRLTSEDIATREKQMDTDIVKLLQPACKAEQQQRVLDLCGLLRQEGAFDMAQRVAGFYHLVGLQEKIGKLKRAREDDNCLEDEREERRKHLRRVTPIAAPFNHSETRQSVSYEEFQPRHDRARPSLAAALPTSSSSPFAQVPSRGILPPSRRTPEKENVSISETTPKRRREEDFDAESVSAVPQARTASTSSVSNGNPFARKTSEKSNPFARQKSLHKSESFFNKLDAAEESTDRKSQSRPKVKTSEGRGKENGQQRTLLGMFSGNTHKKSSQLTNSESQYSLDDKIQLTETQDTEVTMVEPSLVESPSSRLQELHETRDESEQATLNLPNEIVV